MLSESKIPSDILRYIFSYCNPRNLLSVSKINNELRIFARDPIMLKKLAYDYNLPYYEGIYLEELCEYSEMEKSKLARVAVKVDDKKLFMHLRQYVHWDIDIWKFRRELIHTSIEYNSINMFKYFLETNKFSSFGYNETSDICDKIIYNNNEDMFNIYIYKWYTNKYICYHLHQIENIKFLRIIFDSVKTDSDCINSYLRNSNLDIIDILIDEYSHLLKPEQIINIYNFTAYRGIEYNNFKIVKKMLTLGAHLYSEFFLDAIKYDHLKIAKLILQFEDMPIKILNKALTYTWLKSAKIVKFLLDLGANELNKALLNFVKIKNCDMIRLVINAGANNLNAALSKALSNGHENNEIIELLIELGANNLNESLIGSIETFDYKRVKIFLKHGANNYDEAINLSVSLIDTNECDIEHGYNYYDIIRLIKKYKNMHRIKNG